MEETLEKYMQLDDDSLYQLIGEVAIEHQGLQGIESIKDRLKLGKDIFDEYKAQFKTIICTNKKVQNIMKSDGFDVSIAIGGLIVPLISNLVMPGTAILVSALLIKYGVNKYCDFK